MDRQRKIGVVVAMLSEAEALFGRQSWHANPIHTIRPGGHATCLVSCGGIGWTCAHEATKRLMSRDVDVLVSIGVAGGLDPTLQPGDVVVASQVQYWDKEQTLEVLPVDVALAEAVYHGLNIGGGRVEQGRLLTVKQAVTAPEQKASLFEQTGALVVDMESAAVAEVAEQYGVPFMGLRVVCDPASMAVPEAMIHCLDTNGQVQLGRVLSSLVSQPSLLIKMIHMARAFSRARRFLKLTWRRIIDQSLLV